MIKKNNLENINLPSKWIKVSSEDGVNLEEELQKELSEKHPLYKQEVIAVARRFMNDDVLFFLPSKEGKVAVVHLTWFSEIEEDPFFPSTVFYSSIEDWFKQQK